MAREPVKIDLATRLKEARRRVYPTAAEAAAALGMKPVTLRAHENAQNGINVYDLERYARRYGVSVQWLLTGEGEAAPEWKHHLQIGEPMPVYGSLKVDQWRPDSAFANLEPEPAGHVVAYTDPRFPPNIVDALIVSGAAPDGHYIDGTIVFSVVPHWLGGPIDYGHGDHVLLLRRRGEFSCATLRRVEVSEGGVRYVSLTDPRADVLPEVIEKEDLPLVAGVIIGSVTRRPVSAPDPLELGRMVKDEREAKAWAKRILADDMPADAESLNLAKIIAAATGP